METLTTPSGISTRLSAEVVGSKLLTIYREGDKRDYVVYSKRDIDNTAEVLDIKVQSQRGVGIGSLLLQRCVELARVQLRSSLFAFCRLDNKDAHRFYQKNGFVESALVMDMYGKEEHAVMFVHQLGS